MTLSRLIKIVKKKVMWERISESLRLSKRVHPTFLIKCIGITFEIMNRM